MDDYGVLPNQKGKLCLMKELRMNNGVPPEMAKIHESTVQKKYLKDRGNHDGVVTHQEPDILDGEIKWTLGRIAINKASGGD